MAVPKFTYLDIKGFGEAIRLTLYVGKVEFEDHRVSYAQVREMGKDGRLPYGQVPILELDGETYAQSGAIMRWAGRQSGLYPEDEKLQLRCDAIEDALTDIKKLLPSIWYGSILGRNPTTKEPLVPISDDTKAEVLKGLNEIALPYRFGQLERALEKSGGPYFCGEQMMFCDLSFYASLLHLWSFLVLATGGRKHINIYNHPIGSLHHSYICIQQVQCNIHTMNFLNCFNVWVTH